MKKLTSLSISLSLVVVVVPVRSDPSRHLFFKSANFNLIIIAIIQRVM